MAITGLMIIGLLVGINSSVNNQRYRDSVLTLRNDVQSLYDQVDSVRNERDNNWSCDSSAQTSQGGLTIDRGQSSCQMLGRLMTISDSAITKHSIIGYGVVPDGTSASDLTILNTFNFGNVPSMTETDRLEWGTKIAWAKTGVDASTIGSRNLAILVIRSPKSGQVYTFTSDALPTSASGRPSSAYIKSLLVDGSVIPGRKERVVCVESNGLIGRSNMAITLAARANGTSAVESRTNESMEGMSTEC